MGHGELKGNFVNGWRDPALDTSNMFTILNSNKKMTTQGRSNNASK